MWTAGVLARLNVIPITGWKNAICIFELQDKVLSVRNKVVLANVTRIWPNIFVANQQVCMTHSNDRNKDGKMKKHLTDLFTDELKICTIPVGG